MKLTVEALRKQIQQKLFDFEDAYLESFLILQEILKWDRAQILLNSDQIVSETFYSKAQEWTQRRLQGEPLAYIFGFKDFYKSRFLVSPDVLIPRPETETLILSALENQKSIVTLADLGVGSGCIGQSLLLEFPQARLWACDVSAAAIEIAKQNATQLGLDDRIEFYCGDVVSSSFENFFDAVVANPPYIERGDLRVDFMVDLFEPHLALYADHAGLEKYLQWIPWAHKALKQKGILYLECGEGQASAVAKICEEEGFKNIKTKKDLLNIERVVIAQKDG